MALSARLEGILSLATSVETAADIGTDHGLVPAALLERGLARRVIATDLREGPLKAARRLMEEKGLTDRISLRQGDGFISLAPGEAELIIISGMGGPLMQRILRESDGVAKAADHLILSPQSDLPDFRRFLQENDYGLLQEKLVEEEGKFYHIFLVGPGLKTRALTEGELLFGRFDGAGETDPIRRYLQRESDQAEKVIKRIRAGAADQTQLIPWIRRRDLARKMAGRWEREGGKSMSSKLGFGMMRLPRLKEGGIDIELTSKMVDLFLERGGTYFDTAYVYEGSEEATRKALVERHPRESYTLATKINCGVEPKTAESTKAQFETSLARTGAGYFDYYLLHAIMDGKDKDYEAWGIWDFVAEKKREGLIKNMGFSFHDTPELLDKLLTEHPEVDFVQLQINYADWENPDVQSRACYEIARRHGKQIVIMEPVKGGTLAALPQEAEKVFRDIHPEASMASWAIRYAASLDGVLAVLSGMSTLEQVEDNTTFMGQFDALNETEKEAVEQVRRILAERRQIGCTACRYCVEGCPMQIPIPDIFSAMNHYLRFENTEQAKQRYGWRTRDKGKASDCVQCGACEDACPQHLPIRELLQEAAGILE